MANSYVLYPGLTGVQTDFSIPFEYLSQDFVKATVGGTPVSLTFLSTYLVRITPAPSGNVRIYRETDKDPVNTYTNGSILVDSDLNTSFMQSIHISEEVADNAMQTGGGGHWDIQNLRLTNVLDPVDDQDAATKAWVEGFLSDTVDAVEADRSTVNSYRIEVAGNAATVAADKAIVAADKATTSGYKDAAAASAAAAAASAGSMTTVPDQINAATAQATPLDADHMGYRRASDGLFRKFTFTNLKAFLKTYFDTLYQGTNTVLSALAGVGAAVAGDLIYASGAGTWARLAKGSAGSALVMNSAGTFPEWGAAGATKVIASGTVSAAAQLDLVLTQAIADGYRDFELVIQNYVPATDNTFLNFRVSTNGGSSFLTTAYRWVYQKAQSAGAGYSGNANDGSFVITADNGNAANEQVSGYLKFRCGSARFTYEFVGEGLDQLATQSMTRTAGSRSSANVDAIRVFAGSGNITSLDYTLRATKSA